MSLGQSIRPVPFHILEKGGKRAVLPLAVENPPFYIAYFALVCLFFLGFALLSLYFSGEICYNKHILLFNLKGEFLLDSSPIWRQLLLQAALILLNAFFAATEIAVLSLNENKVRKQSEEGNKQAAKL